MNAGNRWALALGLLLAASAGRAADDRPRTDPGSAEDVQDVLFLGERRPLLIRLHVRLDGKPYPARWEEHLTRWFRFLDRDDDGSLDAREAARAPDPRMLRFLLTSPGTNFQFLGGPSLEDIDRDHDKKVSLAEFLHYYRQSPAGPVQLDPAFHQLIPGVRQDVLTDALFAALDRDRDGKLSRAELEGTRAALRKFDLDEDEFVSAAELSSVDPSATLPGRQPPLVPTMQAPAVPLTLVPREDGRRLAARLPVARSLLDHYARDKRKTLRPGDLDIPRARFDRLDTNKDGELDVFELLRWVITLPDAEAELRLSRGAGGRPTIAPVGEKNAALRQTSGNVLAFSTADHCVNLIAAPAAVQPGAGSMRQMLQQQFRTIDARGKGYVSRRQLQSGQFPYLLSVLNVADRDGDDCLSLEELNAWIDLTGDGLYSQTSVALAASGRGLFSLLDVDQDGRLSLRELHQAWARLAPYDRDGDGAIARTELPVQSQVVVNPGAPNYLAGQASVFRPPGAPPVPRGPLWFRRMDRNGDGDVSPREFLGSRADFRRLDADGDGLISLEEAERADAALRKK